MTGEGKEGEKYGVGRGGNYPNLIGVLLRE